MERHPICKLVVKETLTREVEVSFPEVMALVRTLPADQKEQLRKALGEEEKGRSVRTDALLARMEEALGKGLREPPSEMHLAVLKRARQAGADENSRDAEAMWEVQQEAYHRLNSKPRSKRRA